MKIKYKKTWITLLIIVLGASALGWFAYARRDKIPDYDTATVMRRTVVQEVTVTGRVEPREKYELAFASSGVVRTVSVREGDRVAAGQRLATLDVADVALQQAQARAALVGERQTAGVSLEKAQQTAAQTARVNDIKIAEAKQKVRNAKTQLELAQQQFERVNTEDTEESSAAYLSAESSLASAQNTYQDAQEALRVLEAASTQSEKTTQAEIAAAEQVLKLTQDTIAPGVLSANRAAVGYQSAVLSKSVLTAPIEGVISQVAIKSGEYAAPTEAAITLITPELEIQAYVPEADIAKLALSQQASVTLDAYGDDIEFEAVISHIDQTETLVEGLAAYQVTFQFLAPDERVKSGLTANVTVRADQRENVLTIPQRALITRDGQKLVRVVEGDGFREVVVETGLRGSDGTVEIVAGLSEGTMIVVFVPADK